VTNRK